MFPKAFKTFIISALCIPAHATLTFEVVFSANALINYTPAEQQLFQDGLDFWDDIIDGHQDGVDRTWTLNVDSFDSSPVGGLITLGSARPIDLLASNPVAGSSVSFNQFILAGNGEAQFNTNAAAGALQAVTIRHEIGHALGIGTLWEDNQVYSDEVANNSNRTLAGGIAGQYTGANALAAYQAEFDAGATFVPVELDGGPGTANAHWDEQGAGAPTDASGNSLDDELLTGELSGSAFLSNTTIQSLVDIGFTLETQALIVPEPSAALLAGFSLLLLGRRRR